MGMIRFFARPLLAAPFIAQGWSAVRHPEDHQERAENIAGLAGMAGVDLESVDTTTLTRALGAVQLIGGTFLSIGKFQRLSGAALALTQIPVALANHPVWTAEKSERREVLGGLLGALGLAGGAALAWTDRKGKPSLGYRVSEWRDQRNELADVRAQAREQIREAKRS
ncbi:DoxX family protein [Actinotignum schaalii]|uniref:DoxX family protein n=1 Tax=Actinotignum schaalii TaxID=59505 RepID=UPI00373F567A